MGGSPQRAIPEAAEAIALRVELFPGVRRRRGVEEPSLLDREQEDQAVDKTQELVEIGRGRELTALQVGAEGLVLAMGEEALAVLRGGKYFGEMSLIDDSPRSAHALVHEKCKLFVITKRDLEDLLFVDRDLAYELLWNFVRTLTGRLRETNDKMTFLATSNKF